MTKHIYLLLIFVSVFSGCAAFQSGAAIRRAEIWDMKNDNSRPVFAEIRVFWNEVKFRTREDMIGDPDADKKPKPTMVSNSDNRFLQRTAEDVFAEAGMYDRQNGTGTLEIGLVSYGRWNYRSLWKGFLVDTPFVMLLPTSLATMHKMVVGFETPEGKKHVGSTATMKTVFHALIFPLYPFATPASKEKKILRNMLWNSTVSVHNAYKGQAEAK